MSPAPDSKVCTWWARPAAMPVRMRFAGVGRRKYAPKRHTATNIKPATARSLPMMRPLAMMLGSSAKSVRPIQAAGSLTSV